MPSDPQPRRASPPDVERSDHELLVAALAHAWSWVEMRSNHRVQGVNFFLLSIAFMSAAYVAALDKKLDDVGGSIGVAGIVASLAFWAYDFRARELQHIGEEALGRIQNRFADQLHMDELRMVEISDRPRRIRLSGSIMVSAMYVFALVLFTAAATYGFAR